MSESYTPGPWAVHPGRATVDAEPITGEGLTPVCGLLWPTDVRTEEQTYANARLIAAAPELVEALEALRKWGREHQGTVDLAFRFASYADLVIALDAADAVLAKVRGSSE